MLALEKACREYRDKILLPQKFLRLKFEAIANAVRKILRSYRSKEFDKLLAIADPANGVDFIKDVSFYLIRFICNMFCYIV